MGFPRAVLSAYLHSFSFSGRATRAEFWYFQLFLIGVPVLVALGLLAGIPPDQVLAMAESVEQSPYVLFASLLFYGPNWALTVRRRHDTGRRGWWILMAIVPLLGMLVLLVLTLQRSSPGHNRFGQPVGPGSTPTGGDAVSQADVFPAGPYTEDDRKAEVHALYLARVKGQPG